MKFSENLSKYWEFNLQECKSREALYGSEGLWSYQQLDARSNQVAHWLLNKSVSKGDVVALFNTKKFISYAAMLACIKLGVAYVNFDIHSPLIRLSRMLERCKPSIILEDGELTGDVRSFVETTYYHFQSLTSIDFSMYSDEMPLIDYALTGHTIAYIMFTSGSTGIPKGVAITHANLLSFISWSIPRFGVSQKDRFAQLSPMYFDNSVFDFYTALFGGACLVPVPHQILQDPVKLVEYVTETRCTIWFSVPSLLVYLLSLKVLPRYSLPYIRVFVFGGEGFPKRELKKLYNMCSSYAHLVNVYGPTEGTCICSSHDITEQDFEDMQTLAPIGRINSNFEFLILDEASQSVRKGQKGELCIAGTGLSVGYYNDIDRTQQQFVQNPKVSAYQEKIYKTGDLVYEKNGLLWFAGRTDNQIKHMGYRIELEEIEAALHSSEFIQQCAAVYHQVREQHGHIVVFIQAADSRFTEADIRDFLSNLVPTYMLPSRVVFMGNLPKNSNGKVDRRKLISSLIS